MTFTTAFNSFKSEVESVTGFNSKTEIPNAYDVVQNQRPFLVDGYGFAVGSSSDFAAEFNTTRDRTEISVVLVREALALETSPLGVQNAVKQLRDDAEELRKHILGCEMEGISQHWYMSTGPVEFFDAHVYISVNFDVVYSTQIAPC